MIEIGENAKIKIHWKVNPYDFSKEKENTLITKVANKYGIQKDHVKIVPDFVMYNENGDKISVATEVIANIQNPSFQLKLFQEYLNVNEIKDYDFEFIKKIDSEINTYIDYDMYDKYKKYSIKWVKWDNFLSYGEGNSFDFTTLNGLILLNGEPANQSGKSTFAIDLLHFLLFGKTEKAATQEKIFNKHIPESSEVMVEGCLTIDNVDYIIKRTLKRPSLSKRSSRSKTVQKVEYYRIVGDIMEELEEYDVENQQEENSIRTNKAIKEAIGNESDFDMIICATSSNLDELIEKKEAERGKLLSRWIGLLPIEQKDIIAREKFNSEIKKGLYSDRFNIETLKNEINSFNLTIKTYNAEIEKYTNEIKLIDNKISEYEKLKETLLSTKSVIDENLLKVDITTLKRKINDLVENGKNHKEALENVSNEIKSIGEVNYSANEFDTLNSHISDLNLQLGSIRGEYSSVKKDIDILQKSEYCPTCGRKYDNVDNSDRIKELQKRLLEIETNGKEIASKLATTKTRLEEVKVLREKYENLSKLQIKESVIGSKISQLRVDYKEALSLLEEYNKNNEAIDKNNKLDIQIRNVNANLNDSRNTKELNITNIQKDKSEIETLLNGISERETIIDIIEKETNTLRNWRIYLDMVGRNGISKMVLRKTLPIINAQMTQLLSDVCDFTVEISITDKNDIMFYLVKDGVYSDLTSGSGFEKTAASLALRIVLGNISTLPKLSSLILDEVFARVSDDNLEHMHALLNKILDNYQYVMLITHNTAIKDWANETILVSKVSNISSISRNKIMSK